MLKLALCALVIVATSIIIAAVIASAHQPASGCFPCGTPSTGSVCCAKGQVCPGGIPCCATSAVGGWSCNTNCTPTCYPQQQCGSGGCGGQFPFLCGKCPAGDGCNAYNQCQRC